MHLALYGESLSDIISPDRRSVEQLKLTAYNLAVERMGLDCGGLETNRTLALFSRKQVGVILILLSSVGSHDRYQAKGDCEAQDLRRSRGIAM